MVNEIRYTTINRVLDNLLDHPLLRDLTLEQAVRYTIRFISLHGYPQLYEDHEADVPIKDYRGLLPCDLIRIVQVKDLCTGKCLRSMTDSFLPADKPHTPRHLGHFEGSFKTQGRVIFTSFAEGEVHISYKGIAVDEDGFPLLLDNETYLAALEAYIKKQVFTVQFDLGKIQAGVLQNAQRDYAMLAGELNSEMNIPSLSEMESISRQLTALVPRMREFDRGFRRTGDREYLRNH